MKRRETKLSILERRVKELEEEVRLLHSALLNFAVHRPAIVLPPPCPVGIPSPAPRSPQQRAPWTPSTPESRRRGGFSCQHVRGVHDEPRPGCPMCEENDVDK